MLPKIAELLTDIGFETADLERVRNALTHSSYIKEHKLAYVECNERLEFFGDAVLKLAASDILYKKFEDEDEGYLTKLRAVIVSDIMLAKFAEEINLTKYLILSESETKSGGKNRQSIKACAFEALLAALYFCCGYERVLNFLKSLIDPMIDDIARNIEKLNAKATLQEFTQGLNKDLPSYEIIKEIGPAHKKTFEVEVKYQGEGVARGQGKTKREAEQSAAFQACIKMGAIKDEQK